MSTTQVVVLIVVIVVVLAVALGLWYAARRRALRQRFGPEYDRAVAEKDSRLAAERELRDRERRHAQLQLRELDPQSRERYATSWEQVQAKFVDDPNTAVNEADELVTRLIAERGYPTGDYDEQVANLSVEHARTLGHYRDAHDLYLVNQRGEATTEQLRQALVHYRELFADLLGESPVAGRTESAATTRTESAAAAERADRTDEAELAAERHDDLAAERHADVAAEEAHDGRVEHDAHRS